MKIETGPIAPVFLAHGAPTLATADIPAHHFLKGFAGGRPGPTGIVVLSPHWETPDLRVSAPGSLKTIHDFRGFPDALYEISYPATATAELVQAVTQCLTDSGHTTRQDASWGLDHGAWVPLSLAFPDAGIPVVALSLPHGSTPESVFALGRSLTPLADDGVLIVGSGSTTHNLKAIEPEGTAPPDWATAFDAWIDEGLQAGDIGYFLDLDQAPHFRTAHPTEEHLLPLFFAFGAAGDGARPELLHRSYAHGSLSMSYFSFSAPSRGAVPRAS
ncbi:MAG: dioxygenase [Roseibium sp.]|nr:dioxygenase [Roseibium sp.]